ncbi:sterol desaturase family protein [Vibrio agarivorans]|uniref:Sterol desaturase family protein n=1 Tax=Vibrio agarivorans TaxID=153622 RepID=A0ABT7XZ67_9VIBR|nr:sterol desaturase family protein [Vibrio agarivorans]MDN2481074.1 sterol desaturase family protein [Vibrio agarivorans]
MSAEIVRLSFFIGILCFCTVWEILAQRRTLTQSKSYRWLNNLGLVALNGLVLKFTLPILAIELAVTTSHAGVGLLNWLSLPMWLSVMATVVILDLAIYWQHRLFHRVPILWKLHRMHHSDQDIDVTTGARFHPIEIILSMLIKMVVVVVIGAPALGVLIFEIILNGSAMFNHSNARLPNMVDRILRRWVVTPDMHRVHHSTLRHECDSNFGFFLSIWDRWFKSYISQPKLGHHDMSIGIDKFRRASEQRIDKMLTQPFRES